ncbi:MAG: hypothetical protein QXD77_01175 [Candidatus Aenigmatarchaeota archaeon]
MHILVFTEGTAIMHAPGIKESDKDFFKSHIPTKGSVEKISSWEQAGAKISYLTSRTDTKEISQVKFVLEKFKFPRGTLFFRKMGEEFKDVVMRIKPDVWVDDDCASIGGRSDDMKLDKKLGIKEIIVHEFGGLSHLPDNPEELLEL